MGINDDLEVQRRAFEAQFGSLESMGFEDKTKRAEEEEVSSEEGSVGDEGHEESETAGSEQESEEEEEEESEDEAADTEPAHVVHRPRVIKFQGPSDEFTPISKKEQRLLQSGKRFRPEQSEDPVREVSDDDDENLQNDVELQRFLKESHLLSALGSGDGDVDDGSVVGKARARTLEMRLRGLSATNGGSTALEKMPIQVRKGMVDKHRKRIQKHETDAREGGVVLHNVKRGHFRQIGHTHRNDIERRIGSSIKKEQQQRNKRRQRGLRIQSVGRSTRNGLRISQQDIDRINGKK